MFELARGRPGSNPAASPLDQLSPTSGSICWMAAASLWVKTCSRFQSSGANLQLLGKFVQSNCDQLIGPKAKRRARLAISADRRGFRCGVMRDRFHAAFPCSLCGDTANGQLATGFPVGQNQRSGHISGASVTVAVQCSPWASAPQAAPRPVLVCSSNESRPGVACSGRRWASPSEHHGMGLFGAASAP